jgi:general secretion pathway protein G
MAYSARSYAALIMLLMPAALAIVARAAPEWGDAWMIPAAGLLLAGAMSSVVNSVQAVRERVVVGRALVHAPLIVLLGYGALAAAVAWSVTEACPGAHFETARVQLTHLARGADLYRLETGRFPRALAELTRPLEPPVIEHVPNDPWSRAYRYRRDGDAYSLCSDGPDGRASTDDDLCMVPASAK